MLDTKVNLTREDYIKALKFALKLRYAGKAVGDWRSTGTRRTLGQYMTDHASGKMAEMAFAKFLKANFGLEAEIDLKIYPGAQAIDRGDIASLKRGAKKFDPELKIDVKATGKTSKWLLVDQREFDNRFYDAYVAVMVNLPKNHLAEPIYEAIRNGNLEELEDKIPKIRSVEALVAGFAYRKEVASGEPFSRGDSVWDPDKPSRILFSAKTNNLGIPLDALRHTKSDWNRLVSKMCGGGIATP